MTTSVSAANSSLATPAAKNSQPNKISEFAKKTFRKIKNIPTYISKKLNAFYNFLDSHKFTITMIALAIIFAPTNPEASLIALTLGIAKEAYRYYTHSINYQFKVKAKAFIKALTEFNSNFKDGKITTSEKKAQASLEVYVEAQKRLLRYIAHNVKTKTQLDNWEKYLKSLNPKLVLDPNIVRIENGLNLFSKTKKINEHIDAQIELVKKYLEARYFNYIKIYANHCLSRGKKSDLKFLCEVFMKKIPIAKNILEKTQKDVLKDLNWSYNTQKVKNAVTKPFRTIARSKPFATLSQKVKNAVTKPFRTIARSKPFATLSFSFNLVLQITKFVSPTLIPACIIGLIWGGMPRTLQILTYPTSLFTRFMCWTGNEVACKFSDTINNIGAKAV